MQLGRYQILKQLATGTVADVLLARASGLEGFARHVVIKRLRPEMATEDRVAKSFLEEARIAGSLHHQNIVTVHDIGEQDGSYFFAMEYVHGEDARRLIGKVRERGEHIPLEHALSVVMAAAAGLHHAHEQSTPSGERLGLVHRDVSPQNILIGYDGSVKLVDFGMAKAVAKSQTTMTGIMKGKSSYLSPEQCTGKPVDRRTDVFGLGIVLYELVTAQRLFKGANEFMTMAAIVEGVIPKPSTLRREVPAALDEIILRALERSPESRYQTAESLRESLEAFALAQELRTSHKALSDYLSGLFGPRPEPWEVRAPTSDPLPEVDYESTNAKGLVPPPSVSRDEMRKRLALRAESPMMQADATDDEWDEDDVKTTGRGGRASARPVSESQLRTTPAPTVGTRGAPDLDPDVDDEPRTARDIKRIRQSDEARTARDIKRLRPEDVTRTEPQPTTPVDTATDMPAALDDSREDEAENLTVLEPATFDSGEPATYDSSVSRTAPAVSPDDDIFENEVATEIASDDPPWANSDSEKLGAPSKARVSAAVIPRSSLPATKRPQPVAAPRPTPPTAMPALRPTPPPVSAQPLPSSQAMPTQRLRPATAQPAEPVEQPRVVHVPPPQSQPASRPSPAPAQSAPPPVVHVPPPQPIARPMSSPGPGGPATLQGTGGVPSIAPPSFPPSPSYMQGPGGQVPMQSMTPLPFGAAAPPASEDLRGGARLFIAKYGTKLWIAGGIVLVLLVILAARGCGGSDSDSRTKEPPSAAPPAEK